MKKTWNSFNLSETTAEIVELAFMKAPELENLHNFKFLVDCEADKHAIQIPEEKEGVNHEVYFEKFLFYALSVISVSAWAERHGDTAADSSADVLKFVMPTIGVVITFGDLLDFAFENDDYYGYWLDKVWSAGSDCHD